MTALKVLGKFCLVLVFLGPAIAMITATYENSKKSKLDKHGKREIKINRISYLDYLIIIIPLWLLLIILLSHNQEELRTSIFILGIGYSYLLLTPYNNRINIFKINIIILTTCLVLSTSTYFLSLTNRFQSIDNLTVLHIPLVTYIYLQSSRQFIKWLTGTYPISIDKSFRVGNFSHRFNRKATYWDGGWSFWNILLLPGLITLIVIEIIN